MTVYNRSAGSVQVVADAVGYCTPSTATQSPAGLFTTLTPTRIHDTRFGTCAPQGAVPAHTSITAQVTGATAYRAAVPHLSR